MGNVKTLKRDERVCLDSRENLRRWQEYGVLHLQCLGQACWGPTLRRQGRKPKLTGGEKKLQPPVKRGVSLSGFDIRNSRPLTARFVADIFSPGALRVRIQYTDFVGREKALVMPGAAKYPRLAVKCH